MEKCEHSIYGVCDRCFSELQPVWFIEEELGKNMIPTGRKRRAINYLVCPNCLKEFCTDDDFCAGNSKPDYYVSQLVF